MSLRSVRAFIWSVAVLCVLLMVLAGLRQSLSARVQTRLTDGLSQVGGGLSWKSRHYERGLWSVRLYLQQPHFLTGFPDGTGKSEAEADQVVISQSLFPFLAPHFSEMKVLALRISAEGQPDQVIRLRSVGGPGISGKISGDHRILVHVPEGQISGIFPQVVSFRRLAVNLEGDNLPAGGRTISAQAETEEILSPFAVSGLSDVIRNLKLAVTLRAETAGDTVLLHFLTADQTPLTWSLSGRFQRVKGISAGDFDLRVGGLNNLPDSLLGDVSLSPQLRALLLQIRDRQEKHKAEGERQRPSALSVPLRLRNGDWRLGGVSVTGALNVISALKTGERPAGQVRGR
ncbi:hypothetical protein LOC54_05010 [Acetobacter sp. AN02]|uniref:hypothetical protein n=1 Tax=Acetobacter sp. AN02 TaxID=2894186 RepID=UPI0024341052|nr:hypothetical protein [Acetobacter sp. AN02]MDG6094478.1 hypothetical protein [Acetobacter sp. AN02]